MRGLAARQELPGDSRLAYRFGNFSVSQRCAAQAKELTTQSSEAVVKFALVQQCLSNCLDNEGG